MPGQVREQYVDHVVIQPNMVHITIVFNITGSLRNATEIRIMALIWERN
jgi:hypothetical protein